MSKNIIDPATGLAFFTDMSQHLKVQPNPRMLFFLDVATKYTGYAFFEINEVDPSIALLAGYGNFKAPGKDMNTRLRMMTSKISNIMHTIKPARLILEFPSYQGGDKGTNAARSGGTLQLARLCGRIETCWEYYLAMVWAHNGKANLESLEMIFAYAETLTFTKWNGQCTKKITCHRTEEFMGLKKDTLNSGGIENNWADAMMMGKWYLKDQLMIKAQFNPQVEQVDL